MGMISNSKNVNFPKLTKKKITLNSFLTKGSVSLNEMLSDPAEVALLLNFDASDGTLKAGIGLSELLLDGNSISLGGNIFPVKLYYYKVFDSSLNDYDDRLVVYASNKMLYSISLTKKTKNLISTIQFQSEPKAINYNYSGKDVLILSFKKEGLFIIYENSVEYVKNAPSITSMCIHSERLFATIEGDSTELWFSDDFNPTNWFVSLDEAGYVDLPDERGKLLKVISFLDYVYVFRSYGISRVTAYGDQREFSVDNLYNNIGKIYANTVTECGGYVIFLTSSGIYRFNGIDAVKILPFYDKYLKNANNDSAKGVYYNGKLYLSLNMMIDGKTEEGVVLVYDIENKVSYLARGLKISDFELITGSEYQIYAISSDKICKIDKSGRRFNVPLNKVWDSGENDYSIDSVKTLEKIKINFNGNIQISIWVDKKLYVYDLQDGQSELLTMLKGKNFKIKITSRDSSPVIYKPTFYFSYLKEGLW